MGAAILGRAIEVATLENLLDLARGGRAQAALIEGEAGIGKTCLLEEAVSAAEALGFRIFLDRAEELEGSRPFGAILAALGCIRDSEDQARAGIARMLATGASTDPGEAGAEKDRGLQFRVVDALADLVESETLESPVVLAIEDLHWSDPSTLLALGVLSRRLAFSPFALFATFRPTPRLPEIEQVFDAVAALGGRRLVLTGLDDESVRALMEETLEAEPTPRLLEGVAGAAGNPLFVTELAGALRDEGSITFVDGRAEVSEVALPPNLRLTILRRISFLEEETLEALRIASVLGSSFSLNELCIVMEQSASAMFSALSGAMHARFLEEEGVRLRFRHELIREAIYSDLPESARIAVHRDCARRLAEAGEPATRVAEHMFLSSAPGDAEAVEWLRAAALETAAGSPSVGADILERALSIAGPGHVLRDTMEAERSANLLWSGRASEAIVNAQEALDRGCAEPAAAAQRNVLVQAALGQGRVQDALAVVQDAVARHAAPQREHGRLLAWASHAKMLTGDLSGAEEMADIACAAGKNTGDDLTMCIAMGCLGFVRELQGRFAEALAIGDAAIRIADLSHAREGHQFQLGVVHGFFLMDADRLQDAIGVLGRCRRISEEIGARWVLPLYEIGLVIGHFIAGDWDDAIAQYESSINLAEETGTRHGQVVNNAVLAQIALHRNQLSRAEELVAAGEQEFAETGPQFRVDWIIWSRALLLEAAGEGAQAAATLAGAYDFCATAGLMSELPLLAPDLVRLSIAAGDRPRVEQVTKAAEAMTRDEAPLWVRGAALRCRGLADRNASVLCEAVDVYESSGRLLDLALTCEDAGTLLGEDGRTEEARSLLARAVEQYERLGAARDIARVESTLRSMGFSSGTRGRRNRPTSGWESLTASELKVAALVAEGLSNPQIAERLFISRLTVRTHLSHVFAKMGLTSRTQLAALVATHS